MYIQEHAAVGVPIEERAPRLEEGLRLLRALWTQDEVSSEGQFYPLRQVALEPKPLQRPIPIWISSNWVQRGLWRLAEMGDAWITNVPSTNVFRDCWQKIQERAAHIGRDPDCIIRCLYISVNLNTEDEALREGDLFMQAYYSRPYETVNKQLLCVFGPPEKCVETILKYRDEGANYFILRFASAHQMEQLYRFTESVLPCLGYEP